MMQQQEEFSKRPAFQNQKLCTDVKHRTEVKREEKYFRLVGIDR